MRKLRRIFCAMFLAGVSGAGAYGEEPLAGAPSLDAEDAEYRAEPNAERPAHATAEPAMVAVDEAPLPEETPPASGDGSPENLTAVNPVWKSISESRREQEEALRDPEAGPAKPETPGGSRSDTASGEKTEPVSSPENPGDPKLPEDKDLKAAQDDDPVTPETEAAPAVPDNHPEKKQEDNGEAKTGDKPGDPSVKDDAGRSAGTKPVSKTEPPAEIKAGESGDKSNDNVPASPASETDGEQPSQAEPAPAGETPASEKAASSSAPQAPVSQTKPGSGKPHPAAAGESQTAKEPAKSAASGVSEQENEVLPKPAPEMPKPSSSGYSGDRGYYTRGYFENLYLPYFYHTYEVPQALDSFFSLTDIHVAEDSTGLVLGINAADTVGPLDLDGSAEDNPHIRTFCLLALRLGVLHRTENVYLEFFHDARNFFNKKISYSFCTGKSSETVGKKILDSEEVRLDDEFVYAFKNEKGPLLSRDYLTKAFVPYAFDRIREKFLPPEEDPRMEVTEQGGLLVEFTSDPKFRSLIRSSDFIRERIKRTCDNETYRRWVLPRIPDLRYRYRLKDGSLIKEITVSSSTCSATEVEARQ